MRVFLFLSLILHRALVLRKAALSGVLGLSFLLSQGPVAAEESSLLSFEPTEVDLLDLEEIINAIHFRTKLLQRTQVSSEEGPSAFRLAWQGNTPKLETGIDSVRLTWSASLESTKIYPDFSVDIAFEEKKAKVKLSKARFAREKGGVYFPNAKKEMIVAYLHALGAPGMVVIMPIRESHAIRTIVLCPRYPATKQVDSDEKRIHRVYLEDPTAALRHVVAKGTSDASGSMFSGVGLGLAQAEVFASRHFDLGSERTDRVIDTDPFVKIIYGSSDFPQPFQIQSLPVRVAVGGGIYQRNAAGYERKMLQESILWIKDVLISEDLPVDYSGNAIGLGPGLCYAIFDEPILRTQYSRNDEPVELPEDDEEQVEQGFEGLGSPTSDFRGLDSQ